MSLPLKEKHDFVGIRHQDKTHQSAGMRCFWKEKKIVVFWLRPEGIVAEEGVGNKSSDDAETQGHLHSHLQAQSSAPWKQYPSSFLPCPLGN